MAIRIAAVGVSHWHALNDAAYLRHLLAMPDVELVAIQDADAEILAKRAAEVGNPPTYADYGKMLAAVRPDFVLARWGGTGKWPLSPMTCSMPAIRS